MNGTPPPPPTVDSVLEAAGVGLCLLGPDGTVEHANREWLRIAGLGIEEALGQRLWDLFPSSPELRASLSEATRGAPVILPVHQQTYEGREVWVERRFASVDAHGHGEVLFTVIDVTERQHEERRLRAELQRLEVARDAAGLGIFDFDVPSGVIQWDWRVRELFGLGPDDEVTYAGFMAKLHPDDRATVQAAADRALDPAGDGRYQTEYRVQSLADGQERWVATTGLVTFAAGRAARVIGTVQDITGRKQVEESRRESEERLDLHIRSTPLAVIEFGADRRVVAWNPSAQAIFGWSAEEAVGRDPSFMVPESARTHVNEVLDQLLSCQGGQRSVNENLCKDGRTIVCDWVNTSLVAASGEVVGIASMAMDITERRSAEELLRRSEERYRQLFESMTEGFAVHEIVLDDGGRPVDYRFLEVNPAFERITGLARNRVLGQRVRDVLPGIEPHWIERYGRVAIDGRPIQFDYRVADLLRHYEVLAFSPCQNQFATIFSDITVRKETEEALRRSEDRFRAIFEQAAVGVAQIEMHTGAFVAVNDRFCELFGYSRDEIMALRWRDLTRGGGDGQGAPSSSEERFVRRDGSVIWVHLNTSPMGRAGEPPSSQICVVQDITGQRQLQEQLAQAQKLESVGRLAGGVAHDFNNLLTVILSCAQSLHEDVGAGAPARLDEIDEIRAAGRRSADLTRQLLAFARKQVIAPIALDLNLVVRGSESLLHRVLGEDIELVSRLEPRLWTVRCDPGQLEQVILNLAVNARDAMPGGGRLTIETANVQVDARLVALHPFMRVGPYVRMTIGDSGAGMTSEVKTRAFEPFFTTKPPGSGTGLGLATVYGIVKQSDGFVLLESEVDRGTTFEIYLPRTEDVAAEKPETLPATSRGTESVLVVEDDAHVRAVTVRALRAAGYQVIAADTGREALGLAAREEHPLDLLVTDVIMPAMSGAELAGLLRRQRPDLRVLYVSGYAGDALSQRGIINPETELLMKPFTAAVLQERVRKVLDAGWTEKLATGISVIDDQHRAILTDIAALEMASRRGDLQEALRLLGVLEVSLTNHFATEEHHMLSSGYLDLENHRDVHRSFVADYERRKANDDTNASASLVGLSEWLDAWLHEHVRGPDTKMAYHLRSTRRP